MAFDVETSARVGLTGEYRYVLGPTMRGTLDASYFNESIGGANTPTAGYHETITRFYVLMIRTFLQSADPALPLDALAQAMIASGLEAHLATVDLKKLSAEFAGRRFDAQLLSDLPDGIDPCGENGEFHTCVVAGPMFSHRLAVATGERIERDGYAYCDLVI